MKSQTIDYLVEVIQALTRDLSTIHPSIERDGRTIERRIKSEGFAFLKILDSYHGLFLAWIEGDCKHGFAVAGVKSRGGYPLIFGGMLKAISSLYLRRELDSTVNYVYAINQMLSIFLKLPGSCERNDERDFARLVTTDSESRSLPYDQIPALVFAKVVAQRIVNDVDFMSFDDLPDIATGPGECYEKLTPVSRWSMMTCPAPLEDSFLHPMSDLFLNRSHAFRRISRFTTVDKSITKRRGICIESAYLMFHQKYAQNTIYKVLKTKHRNIDVTDQSRNQDYALRSSLDRKLVTIDLKDASDRVSLDLVRYLFSDTLFLEHALASRSTHVECNGIEWKLNMFGTMGNALTFPVQTIVFYSILEGLRIARSNPKLHRSSVYGDDIIADARLYADISALFDFLGFNINQRKTFKAGYFRESCGIEAFHGADITPFRLRSTGHENPQEKLTKYHDYIRDLYSKGLWNLMTLFRDKLSSEGLLQFGRSDSPYPCVPVPVGALPYLQDSRVSRRYQTREFRVFVVKSKKFDEDKADARLLVSVLGKHGAAGPAFTKRNHVSLKKVWVAA